MVSIRQPATKGLEDPALQGLPRANVRRPGQFDPRQFETVPNVPVFAEHQTTAKDGRTLRFGPNELKAVVDRCNRRINETGDYAAVTFGHTPDPNDPNGQMPDVAGFAGPFRLGTVGEDGARKRYAILADFHIYRGDFERFKKHPRRSPELWLEDTFEEMFLDPIAVLGAEAPRLDLGLLYSAQRHGKLVEKYAAAAPSSTNTFIPSSNSPRKMQAGVPDTGGATMISPEDLRQLMDAFEQTDIFQWARGKMEQEAGVNATVPAPDVNGPQMPDPAMGAPDPGMAPPMGMDAGAPPPAPPAGLAEAGPPPPAEAGPPMPPPEKPQQYAAEDAAGEYQTADQGTVSGSKVDHDPIGTPTQDYAAYEHCDKMDDDEFEKYNAGYEGYKKQRSGRRRSKYEAAGSADGKSVDKPAQGGADYDAPGPMGDGDADDDAQTGTNAAGEYQDATPPKKYSRSENDRQLDEVRQKLDATEKKLVVERGQRIDAERYTKLSDMRYRYAFDVDEEVERTKYGRMSDTQFDDHVASMEKNYRGIPLGHFIPTHTDTRNSNGSSNVAVTNAGPSGQFAREKYSKEDSERAKHICEVRAGRGETPDYELVLADIQAGKPIEA